MFSDKKNIAYHSESKKSFFIKNAWHCTDTGAQILDIARVNPYSTEIISYKPWISKGFF